MIYLHAMLADAYDNGVDISVYVITGLSDSLCAVYYRCAFSWHGHGRPTGTGWCHCVRV